MAAEKGRLSIRRGREGPSTEVAAIRVLDESFRLVDSGWGELEASELEPGIYRVQAQVPGDKAES